MNSAVSELIALTQVYLLQEYSPKEWIWSDPETYQFFKTRADKTRITPAKQLMPEPKPIVQPVVEPKVPLPIAAEAPKNKSFFTLEPLGAPKPANLGDMRTSVTERLGQVKITETVPEPRPKALPVIVLSLGETGEELLFLRNVTSAIDRLLMPAELVTLSKINSEDEWQALMKRKGVRWIIAFGEAAARLPQTGSVTVLVQPEAKTLLSDPQQKAALWKMLKQTFS